LKADPRSVARHEAAHIVVGVTCGLRLRRATAVPESDKILGWTWFHGDPEGPHREALALMFAAGVAWERGGSPADRALLRELVSGRHAERAMIRAADAIIGDRYVAIKRVAEALLHRDLTGADINALARGDRLD